MRWVPMASDFDEDPRIVEVGWDGGNVFLALLRICGKVGAPDGRIPAACSSAEYVARKTSCPRKTIDRALADLERVGLIRREDGVLVIASRAKWNVKKHDPTANERSRRFRGRQREYATPATQHATPLHGVATTLETNDATPLHNDATQDATPMQRPLARGGAQARRRGNTHTYTQPPNPPQAGGGARADSDPETDPLAEAAFRLIDGWAERRRARDPMAFETREDAWPVNRGTAVRHAFTILERYPDEAHVDAVLVWADTDGPHDDGFAGWRAAIDTSTKLARNFESARSAMIRSLESDDGSNGHDDADEWHAAPVEPETRPHAIAQDELFERRQAEKAAAFAAGGDAAVAELKARWEAERKAKQATRDVRLVGASHG